MLRESRLHSTPRTGDFSLASKIQAILALILVCASCASDIEVQPVTNVLQEVNVPSYGSGDTWVWETPSGEQVIDRIVGYDENTWLAESSVTPGCKVRLNSHFFGPALQRTDCVGVTNTQSLETEGALFPLRLGNTITWRLTRRNVAGETDQYVDPCTVADTARVSVPAGEFDTYVIKCTNATRQREHFFAPALNSAVIYRRVS